MVQAYGPCALWTWHHAQLQHSRQARRPARTSKVVNVRLASSQLSDKDYAASDHILCGERKIELDVDPEANMPRAHFASLGELVQNYVQKTLTGWGLVVELSSLHTKVLHATTAISVPF